MFGCRRVRGRRRSAQEFWRGDRRAAGDDRRGGAARARARSCGATAGATAATSCTSAWRCCSSASPRRRRSRTPRDVRLRAGPDRCASAATTSRYDSATSRIDDDGAATSSGSSSAPCSTCARDGELVARWRPSAATTRRSDASGLGPVGRFFEGEATSEVGAEGRPAPRPVDGDDARHRQLMPIIERGRRGVRRRRRAACRPRRRRRRSAIALSGLVERYARAAAARDVPRCIVSPLVTWIWIGALIVFARRADRAVAGARRRAAPRARRATRRASRRTSAGPRPRRRRGRPRRRCSSSSRARGRRARRQRAAARGPRREPSRARRARGAPSSRRPRRPSTARSATPSWTSAPASSPRPTGARSTASCAPRRSRSCATLDDSALRTLTIPTRWRRSSPSSRSCIAVVPDLPGAHALGEGRRPVRRLRRRHRRGPARRRLARRAQPEPLDDRVRGAVRR